MNESITATLVPLDKRMDFLPSRSGGNFLKFEMGIYSVAEAYTEYDGGYWEMYELSNGGFFIAPDRDVEWHFSNASNYSDVTLSSEALGIVASLYVLSHMSFEIHSLGHFYHLLLDYARQHKEYQAILEAID